MPVPRGSIWGKRCRWPARHWQGVRGHGRDEQPHGMAPAVSVQSPVSRASSASRRETGDILLIKDIQSARGIFGNLNVDTTVVKLAFRAWLPHAQRGVAVPDPGRPLSPTLSPGRPATPGVCPRLSSWQPESRRVFPLHRSSSHPAPSREFRSLPTDPLITSSLTMCKSACLFLIYLLPSDFTSQLVSRASPSGDPAVTTDSGGYNQAPSCSPSPKPCPTTSPAPRPTDL